LEFSDGISKKQLNMGSSSCRFRQTTFGTESSLMKVIVRSNKKIEKILTIIVELHQSLVMVARQKKGT
jgi:hypothetical protein